MFLGRAEVCKTPHAFGRKPAYIRRMSRAFVKEQDGSDAFEELPERLISPHPNLVTEQGLAQIEHELAGAEQAYAAAQAAVDRAALAAAGRDVRYWSQRRASAELVPPPVDASEIRFGSRVTIVREDGRRQSYRIVGEDEADPARGTLSYVSPLARALIGKGVGDTARIGPGDVEIVAID